MYLLPCIHPAAILHGGAPITDIIAADLGKAKRISESGPQLEEHILYVIPGNPLGIEKAFQNAMLWMDHWLRVGASLGVDVETSGLEYFNCKLYSIALGDPEAKVGISFTLMDFHTLPDFMEHALVAKLRQVLADPAITKIYHNAPFDRAVLQRKGFQINGHMYDTMALAHLVQPDIPKDLGWVGQTYLDCGPWKLDHGSSKMANTRDPIQLLIYNARDALYTALCVAPLIHDIHSRGMSQELISWQMAFVDLATNMEIRGLPVNFEVRRAMALEMKQKLGKLKHSMQEFLGLPDFNPMADEQRRQVLFGAKYAGAPWNLGLVSTKKTKKTEKASTSYKAIIDHLEHPFVRMLADYIETRHTYATQYKDGTLRKDGTDPDEPGGKNDLETPGAYQRAMCEDGRLHAKWNSVGTTGSRYSSGPNVQNQRKKDRRFFEAPEGRCFVAADKAALELRIMAVRAGIKSFLDEMQRLGGDPHRMTARYVYGDAFDQRDKKEQKRLRDMVKNVAYASIYMAGVDTVWRTIRERKQLDAVIRAAMNKGVVRHIHSSFFMRYPEIKQFHDNNMQLVAQNGYMEIPPFGRRRYYPVQPAPYNEVASWSIQPVGSDIVGAEMCLIDEELRKKYHGSAYVSLHGHDQIVIECEQRHAEDIKILVDNMFGTYKMDGPAGPVTLTADPIIGKTLLDVKG